MSLEFIEVIIESEKANDELFDLYPKVQLVHSRFVYHKVWLTLEGS